MSSSGISTSAARQISCRLVESNAGLGPAGLGPEACVRTVRTCRVRTYRFGAEPRGAEKRVPVCASSLQYLFASSIKSSQKTYHTQNQLLISEYFIIVSTAKGSILKTQLFKAIPNCFTIGLKQLGNWVPGGTYPITQLPNCFTFPTKTELAKSDPNINAE